MIIRNRNKEIIDAMEIKSEQTNLTIGILAHVDAGKTTLSEALLYLGGSIRKIGRVDNKDAYLDTHHLERERGITIFSKQATVELGERKATLLDTPGHVDFSAEMERTLQVLDCAILVISAKDGVQAHTLTLWKLLKNYRVPTFIFVNKMDQPGADKKRVLEILKNRLSENIVDFSIQDEKFMENVASVDEELIEKYFAEGFVDDSDLKRLIAACKLYPCFFGSALKIQGVQQLMEGIENYTLEKSYPEEFSARVFKVSRDEKNQRLTHMKITGGSLSVKEIIGQDKVNQIRIYSGASYNTVDRVYAGAICAVAGLNNTVPGQGLGQERDGKVPMLEPVLNYRVIIPENINVNDMYIKLKQLQEEEPELRIVWNKELGQIHTMLMGQVQLEILGKLIEERFGVQVSFGKGNIVYKETIKSPVEGMGHYEPLKHYAEVHLLMEPLPRGSGLDIDSNLDENSLAGNWQSQILTSLGEKSHRGVLTGSEITDMKITLIAGKAHIKHTEGGDFRQATCRAVRQGLMRAESVLLEPYYNFRLEIPSENLGRALNDIDRMKGNVSNQEIDGDLALVSGSCPAFTMMDYHMEVISYTKGMGRLFLETAGYDVCHNSDEVIENIAYNPDGDLENPASSVFCSHGAGVMVPWNEVENHMHIPSIKEKNIQENTVFQIDARQAMEAGKRYEGSVKEERELEEIFARTYGVANADNIFHTNADNRYLHGDRKEKHTVRAKTEKAYIYNPKKHREEYMLVDGYNIIFAWQDLKELARLNIDSARDKLIDIVSDYTGAKNLNLILVFDAYKVKEHQGEKLSINGITVVYTAEDQTADAWIEAMAHKIGRKYDVTVVTSDGLEQLTVLSQGCRIISSNEFKTEYELHVNNVRQKMQSNHKERTYLLDNINDEVANYIKNL